MDFKFTKGGNFQRFEVVLVTSGRVDICKLQLGKLTIWLITIWEVTI